MIITVAVIMLPVASGENATAILFKFNLNLRHIKNFYQPPSHLTTYQNGVYCMGIKVYNSLPSHIEKELHNPRKFETCLKHFLYAHYFYYLKEYFNIKTT
jgi:hypothetical protein